ncbi:glucokinase [Homoserinimonas aerilata]|uniref:Glucokinase n=1 Tax=Homoserinimonas aerilata TaxID=1162970 RepID=A0A542YK62_9MICO|nr:ROK family protein [Homoserinimonas aerilata]TQL48451.1 glucokinase [Homoserinimonas aerilata]
MPLALAVDFGGTKVEAALVDENGAVLPESRFRAPTGAASDSQTLADAVDGVATRALATLPAGAELAGVGIGSAGPIEVGPGLVSPLNVPAWRGHPLRTQLETLVPGLPVRLQMDGLCITIAEHWIGAGRGIDNLMGMVVSTGVGGGLILGGRPQPGPTGNAGHIGHIEVGGYDEPCLCGGTGCLEAVASGPKTVEWARRQGWQGSTGEELAAAYEAGDQIARAAIERCGRALGQALASATALADLELIAIGGGFSKATPELFTIIRETMAARAGWDFVAKVRVVPSALSGDGPLAGAAALIHLG